MRRLAVVVVLLAGAAVAAVLALVPYSDYDQRSELTVACGRPAFAWRTEAVVSGGPFAGTGGASVENHPLCGKGVTERLAAAVAVAVASALAGAAIALVPGRGGYRPSAPLPR